MRNEGHVEHVVLPDMLKAPILVSPLSLSANAMRPVVPVLAS